MSTAVMARPEAPAESDYWQEGESWDTGGSPERPLDRVAGAVEACRSDVRLTFDLLADELESAMLVSSSTRRVARLPAYAELLALDAAAIPLLLERLREPGARPLWLRLLGALTTFQPGAGQRTVTEAAEEWARWGKLRGYTDASRA